MIKSFNIKNWTGQAFRTTRAGLADIGKWTLKAFCFMLIGAYVFSSGSQVKTWGEIKWIRLQDFALFDNVIRPGYPAAVADKWIAYRPLSESRAIIDKTRNNSEKLAPTSFLNLSNRARRMGEIDDAKFWSMLALFRLRYDTMRCASVTARDAGPDLAGLLLKTHLKGQAVQLTTEEQIRFGRAVLAYDTEHPARNDPSETCNTLKKLSATDNARIAPIEDWDKIRFLLRRQSDAGFSLLSKQK